jgi:rhamnosyltransferase
MINPAKDVQPCTTVSVIIPTLNAESKLKRMLSMLNRQTIPLEIVIIDSLSTDNTGIIAKECNVKLISIEKKDFNHGATRNMGALHAEGSIILFMTQDAIPLDKYCIENLIKPLEVDSIAAVYGRQIPREESIPTEKFARLYNYPEEPIIKGREQVKEMGIKTFFFSNVFSAIRRKEFYEIGGFPENVLMFEDMLFAAKLIERGYGIAYVPEAKVIHSHDYSLVQQFRRYYQAGVSFQKNPWFMRYAASNKEGVRFLKEEIRFLFKQRKYPWTLYAVLEAICKYAGYRLGLNNNRLPHFLNKGAIG